MPNYRQKNRNRNKNKNRNKQQQQQQQQQQKQEHTKSSETSVSTTAEKAARSPTTETQAVTTEEFAKTVTNPKELETCDNAAVQSLDEHNVITCGTVASQPAKTCNESACATPECIVANDHNMGNEKSKIAKTQEGEHTNVAETQSPAIMREVPSTPRQQAKVIVHRIVCEDIAKEAQQPETHVNRAIKHKDVESNTQEIGSDESNSLQIKETVDKDFVSQDHNQENDIVVTSTSAESASAKSECKSDSDSESESKEASQEQVKVIIHQIHINQYDDSEPAILSPVHIEEVGDESLTDVEELKSPVVSEVESAAEYEDVDTESDVSSTAATNREKRKQKRIALESHFLPQMLNPRFLDSISEENSDLSECGENPLSRSESSESASNPNELKAQKLNAKFPKSSLDFSRTHKHTLTQNTQDNRKPIREEPLAVAVAARFQETPGADESCTTLKSFLSPESELAEMVFINSASSSMSDLNDMDFGDRVSLHSGHSVTFGLDTDARDLINKPAADRRLTSSASASSVADAAEMLQNNGEENDSRNVNNSQIPSSASSPAVHQLVLLNCKEEQNSQELSTLLSCGSGQQSFANDDAQCLLFDTQARLLETSCDAINTSSTSSLRADKNAKPPQVLSENVQNMNTVRDILNTDDIQTANTNDLKLSATTTAQQSPAAEQSEDPSSQADPKKLRLLCAESLAALPYGDEVLEELATLAQNIGEVRSINVVKTHNSSSVTTTRDDNMPYPMPELPHIDDLQLCLNKTNSETPRRPNLPNRPETWLGVPTNFDPKVLVCLSPSQRSYIQQQQQKQQKHQHIATSVAAKEPQKPDDLLDAHQKFVERRGYHEYTKEQLANLEREKLAEQQLLETAAMMKKLRKSLTPPPPQIPPPPVPAKSSETAVLAQNLSKRSIPLTSSTTTSTIETNNNVTSATNEADAKARSDGEENKHRLLSIIQDTSDSRHGRHQQKVASTTTSSVENNSRQTTSNHQHPATPHQQASSTFIVPITLVNESSTKPYKFPPSSGNMQSVESSLGEMFPTLGASDIFDNEHKRFSNIESSTNQTLLDTKPKRYSCVETHSYESQKRVQNGQVVHDYSNSKHEKQKYGDAPETETEVYTKFPSRPQPSLEAQSFSSATAPFEGIQSILTAEKAKPDDHEIMSALKLNKHSTESMNASRQTTTHTMSSSTTTADKSVSNLRDEVDFAKSNEHEEQQKQNASERMTRLKRGIEDTYEEFRQRAKDAATAAVTSAVGVPPTAQVTSNGESTANGSSVISSSSSATTTNKTIFQHDHEKLFKEFDDLSKQLNKELEMGKTQREQKEKSASLFDLNRVQLRQKEQIEQFNKERHDHMKELEREIERSMKSRQLRMGSLERTCSADLSNGRTYQIPIQLENGYAQRNGNGAPPVPQPPQTYQIPVQLENGSTFEDSRQRRAESMFNLSTDGDRRQRTYSNQQKIEDDWSKYASDLGSSENIARPFAKEVEICYQRRPGGIRAPRLTASTNDLSYNMYTYDQNNAYNVRRSHAPMLNRAPQQNRPQFGSCYSMIERDPNPKYISTTTRRGVSPAPQPSGFHPMEVSVSEDEMRQRRASLPRELHEQQLKYIASKEEELRTEFERLQNERRRLMEEVSKASTMPMTPLSPRPMRDSYRCVPKLPTLTEDEVFRQQMAEEWLNKVAEREKRRLQNVIKISKIHEDEGSEAHTMQKNLGDEFLNRVKERRTKLAMPADSDWESGAESHPANQAQFSETEDAPTVKIIEGDNEANLRSLPRHLREFAKFSNHQQDEIEGGHREQHQEEERSQETTDNSISKAFKKSTVVKTVKSLRAPMLPENGGHDTRWHYPRANECNASHRSQTCRNLDRPMPNPSSTRRPRKQTRFLLPANRRSWSESDLLQEIDKDLKLAKGFLFQDEKAQSPSMFTPKFKAKAPTGSGIWSPKNQTPSSSVSNLSDIKSTPPTPPPLPTVWTPQQSPQSARKEYRPIHFDSPTLPRRRVPSTSSESPLPPWNRAGPRYPNSFTNLETSNSDYAQSQPDSTEFIPFGVRSHSVSDKIRIYNVKCEYMSEPETENERPRKMAQLVRRQYDGIGPTTNDGMPIILRSEVKEPHQHEWYKRLYQTIHKQKHGDDYVIRYKQPRGRSLGKSSGYLSEPEPSYDSDYSTVKYRPVNPQRLHSASSALNVRSSNDKIYGTLPNPVKAGQSTYKNQPGRIEDYVTGHSSVSEKESKEWWDEVMDIFNLQLDQAKLSSNYTEGNLSRALAKESGYTSDSNLVFRKKELPPNSPLSPIEQRKAYKTVQAGGEPPLFGFRKPAPEKSREFSKALPSFISLEQEKRQMMVPPAPPNRKSMYTKSPVKKSTKGSSIPSSSLARHEKCFKSPVSPVLGGNKYGTITLRKSTRRGSLCRSKSAGAVSSLLPRLAAMPSQENRVTIIPKSNHLRTVSPLRKPTALSAQVVSGRHTSRSPVAFGRSISKERTFAEEKKRLENSLPLNRFTFEASTNILRDPSLKSPQDVKKAVRSLAHCAVQSRSRSVPRFCTGCRNHATLEGSFAARDTSYFFPEMEHYGYTEWSRPPKISTTDAGRDKRKKVDKTVGKDQISKATSNVSLAGSTSTFSMGDAVTTQASKAVNAKVTSSNEAERKMCKKLAREASKVKSTSKKVSEGKPVSKRSGAIQESSLISQQKVPHSDERDEVGRHLLEKPSNVFVSTVRDKMLFWNDYNLHQTTSLPYKARRQTATNVGGGSGHKSRSLSPNRNHLRSQENGHSLPIADVGRYDAIAEADSTNVREFSPTREIRVPPSAGSRNVRSPSRRRIDSCRSNNNSKVVRASSLSSAEDRSKRGLYLCDELAHSATSLASNDRHSPTCRYLHNSERFVELNRFYSTLERVGQLERATSKTDFKPIRKESELLDYEEWRRVRLHERAEKELNYLVCKLKQDQHEKNLLFLPKDVCEVKWRKEADIGLNSRDKSVEDLRENFENINFLQDYLDHTSKSCCNMKYWRRNTVADLTHSLEGKIQNAEPAPQTHDMPFSEQLVNALPNDQISKISRQLNEIYSYDPKKAQSSPSEQFVVTVEHHNMPSSSHALKVRCKSSITRDELLGSIMKKKQTLSGVPCESPDIQSQEDVRNEGSDQKQPPEIPPAPKLFCNEKDESRPSLSQPRDTPDITQKIKYFEERKYDKPPKTIYHAREDSSPDEDEVMRLIEEKMRLKQYRSGWNKRNELSSSLTDLCGMFGEKNTSRVNFHLLSPQQRPPDEYSPDYQQQHNFRDEIVTELSEDGTPYSSLQFLESYCRSRSASPQSQCSAFLQRVNTGDVQKIRDKFESLSYNSLKSNHFFGLRKLRKVRSDPELNVIKSESKDASKDGDVSWITHKFEMHNKIIQCKNEEPDPKRGRKRLVISPQYGNRLMPHIDRISKTAALGACKKRSSNQSPTRSQSSSSGAVERLKSCRHMSQQPLEQRRRQSMSSPDIRDINQCIPQYLNANWIAHRYPSPEHNKIREQKPVTIRKTHSPVSRAPMAESHKKLGDIFANQKFDPRKHQPKARYVPDGGEAKHQARLQWSQDMSRKGNAVKFQDYDLTSPQPPPPTPLKGDIQNPVSPNRYYESDVNIHFKTPVRQEFKSPLSEEELTARQAEQMQKLYQEERRRKYLQELQDMNSRRHTDNFTPSQKSPIALNRYDDFPADLAPKSINQIKSVARALYNFQAQNSKELSFKKGDIIYIRRAIDKNWYEGEHNAMIGLFPANYVEIINKEPIHPVQSQPSQRKPSEGQARAKYNFQAQSGVELSLNKGELVALTRRVDDNWFEGRIANRKGIFPVSYVEVLTDIGAEDIAARTTTIQHVSTVNARPSLDALRTNINNEFNSLTRNGAQAPNSILRDARTNHKTDILHVDTSSEPLVYRALYKYRPQNSDELELSEGDIVHVLEKCDDGWYVGTSQRTGCFGTFPGNYVERF